MEDINFKDRDQRFPTGWQRFFLSFFMFKRTTVSAMDLLGKIEQKQIDKLAKEREIPEFETGDTVRVNVLITEGGRERTQAFEGLCIARKKNGINSSFTVRKISYGEGVERVFPLYSPKIDSIEVVRRGDVRRSKLYYLRGRRGKSARIKERSTGRGTGENEKAVAAQ